MMMKLENLTDEGEAFMGYVTTKIYKSILLAIVLGLLIFAIITLTFNKYSYSHNFVRLKDISLIHSDDACLLIIELMPARNTSLVLINYSLNLPINNRTCLPGETMNLNLPIKYEEPLRIVCSGELSKSYNDTLTGKIIVYTNQDVEEHTFMIKPKRIGCIGCPH